MASDPESESPGVKGQEKMGRISLASKLGLGDSSRQSNDYTEPEEEPTGSEEEQGESEGNDEDAAFTGLLKTIKQNVSRSDDSTAPASRSSTIVEPVRPSALAARRHLQRPPRNVNVASHRSPSYARTHDDTDDDTFPGPTPLPPLTGVTRGPMTANLRAKIEARIYESDLMEIIDAYAEENVNRDGRFYTPRQRTPMTEIVFGLDKTDYESPIAALRVRMLLTPAIILLSRPSSLKADDVENAIRYARSAQDLARSEGVEEALKARCSYYIGLAAFLLLPKHTTNAWQRPTSIGSRSELGKPDTVQSYFEHACLAKGIYEEGTWAEEWVDYLKAPEVRRKLSISVEERPTSSGSWVSGWLQKVWGSKDNQQGNGVKHLPVHRSQRRNYSVTSQGTDSTFQPSGPERIPSFESWHMDDSRPSSSASTNSSKDALRFPPMPVENASPTTSPSFSSLRSPTIPKSESEDTLPAPVTSPSPKTSPTRHISIAALSSPVYSDSDVSVTSPAHPRRHSRRTSLLAMVTGRERRPSEIEQAEEGDSPYRATFEGVAEEPSSAISTSRPSIGEGVRKRKQTAGPEDMV